MPGAMVIGGATCKAPGARAPQREASRLPAGAAGRAFGGALTMGGALHASSVTVRRRVAARAVMNEGSSAEASGDTIEPARKLVRQPGSTTGPFNVLITGSTKGIGRALAEEFLKRGDSVLVCSRTERSVRSAVKDLSSRYDPERVRGIACDVSDQESVERLAAFATEQFGAIDLWINNAGSNGYKFEALSESEGDMLEEIVSTNVLGTLVCCRQAIRTMREQPAGGHIFLMDGAGGSGTPTPRFAAYGATKRCLGQLIKSLNAELKTAALSDKVCVHNLSPGMVTTQLLMSGTDSPQAKWFINCLAEEPHVVAQNLVPRLRDVPAASKKNADASGALSSRTVAFLTPVDAVTRIGSRILFERSRNRFVQEEGDSRLPPLG
ncbi:unnamed protein product [Pedinophyceae sp. YPF-701]|nr:unnamed protein product [Pedinophyceae sp. YPF-701]